MLEIINDLRLFFEDCYRRINVREYARIMRISAPTASKLLAGYAKKRLLLVQRDRNYIFYYANKDSKDFIDLSRIYWRNVLADFVVFLDKRLINPTVILFGSLSKAEVKKDSDIDLAIFAEEKKINFSSFEKSLKRNIQIFYFDSIKDIKSKEFANNIVNGYILSGRLVL